MTLSMKSFLSEERILADHAERHGNVVRFFLCGQLVAKAVDCGGVWDRIL